MFSRLRRDNKGASVVIYVFILPLFILLVFGSLEIWKVMSVRYSLTQGVYKAARKLSSEGMHWPLGSASAWESIAHERAVGTIKGELDENKLIPTDYTLRVQVAIEPEGRANPAQLGWFFTIRAELMVPGLITLPVLNFGTVTFVERQVSYIEGLSGHWLPPTPAEPY